MKARTEKDVIKLPRGQGCFTKDPKKEGLLQYRKVIHVNSNNKKRICVIGYSVAECMEKMRVAEEKLKNSYYETDISALNDACRELSLEKGVRRFLFEYKSQFIKPRTLDRHEATLENQICKYDIAKILTKDITESILQIHLKTIYDQYSLSVVRKTKDVLNMYFEYVYKNNPLNNPMRDVKIPGTRLEQQKKVKQILPEDILNDDQIKLFKITVDKDYHKNMPGTYRYGYLFYFLIATYLRIGEAQALTWKDIDFKNRTIRITKNFSPEKDRSDKSGSKTKYVLTTPKNVNSIRTVHLTNEAIWALKKQREQIDYCDDDPLFMTEGRKIARESNLLRALRVVLRDAGINMVNDFDLHRLRHTGISYCIRHGVPIQMVSEQAGHDVTMTQNVYYHIIAAQHQEYLNIMDNIG